MSTDKLATKSDLQNFYNRILPYLGGTAEAGFTPVGTVISVMGKTAPANYLPCDGRVVNISDYPELANYFKEQFGSSNYFGGDGTTTFGIVDLSGEFLRGAGTNSHANQGSGAEVGEHQDATKHLNFVWYSSRQSMYQGFSQNSMGEQGQARLTDSYPDGTTAPYRGEPGTGKITTVSTTPPTYTARPTNTSVLFCIATKNIYLNPSTTVKLYEGNSPTVLSNNTITASSASVTLSESIEHFSRILIIQLVYTNPKNGGVSSLSREMPVEVIKSLYGHSCIEMSECNPDVHQDSANSVGGELNVHMRSAWGFYDATHLSQTWASTGFSLWGHNNDKLYVYGIV